MAVGAQRADVLHVDAVDLADLGDEQVDEAVLGQLHDELVDRPAGAPLEDLDADHVAPHGADPAGDLTEGTGAVGQPDAHEVRGHDGKVATAVTANMTAL